MPISTVEIRNVAGTQAALGWADNHTLIIDRATGRAGGMGLGFNGAQLLGLATGGCFANDLRYMAAEMGVQIREIAISVDIVLEGDPVVATRAEMRVGVSMTDDSDPTLLIERTKSLSMAMNSLARGLSVKVTSLSIGPNV